MASPIKFKIYVPAIMFYNITKILQKIRTELVYGGHIVSLISPALILSVVILQNSYININPLIISYIIPLIVYSYNYQNESENVVNKDSEKHRFVVKRKKIFPFLMGLDIFIFLVLAITSFNYGFVLFTLIIITGGILYTLIFKVLTRYIFCFKNIYVSAIWAYAGTFFLLFYNSIDFSIFYLAIFIYVYFKILINNIYFDIKDVNDDKGKDLMTVPIKLGKNNTINILHALNIFTLIILLVMVYFKIFPVYSLLLLLTNIYVFYYVEKGRHAEHNNLLKYTYIMADAEFILWPILLIIGKIFLI